MTAIYEMLGSNGLVQVSASRRLLRLAKTVPLYALDGSGRYFGHFEMDHQPSPYTLVAMRCTGWFRPHWGTGPMQWYFFVPPAGTRMALYAETETPGQTVTAYIYDVPPPPPAAFVGRALYTDQGECSFFSGYRYMNVVGMASGTFPGAEHIFSYGVGTYAVCPTQEAQHIYETGRWNEGGMQFIDFDDWVNWWRCDSTGVRSKFVNVPSDVPAVEFLPFHSPQFRALIHHV